MVSGSRTRIHRPDAAAAAAPALARHLRIYLLLCRLLWKLYNCVIGGLFCGSNPSERLVGKLQIWAREADFLTRLKIRVVYILYLQTQMKMERYGFLFSMFNTKLSNKDLQGIGIDRI
jgi:hypothetical protein